MPLTLPAAFLLSLAAAAAPQAPQGGGRNPFAPPPAAAIPSDYGDSRDAVHVGLRADRTNVAPGETIRLAIVLDHQPHFHVWPSEGPVPEGFAVFDGAIRTAVAFASSPEGVLLADPAAARWPEIHAAVADVGEGPKEYAVFSDRAVVVVPVHVAADAEPGPVRLTASLTFQACNESECLMPVFDEAYTIAFQVVAAGSSDAPSDDPDFAALPLDAIAATDPAPPAAGPDAAPDAAGADGAAPAAPATVARPRFFGIEVPSAEGPLGLLLVALLAMLGGFVLNLTPCVLPVIPIKIMTISKHAASPGRNLTLGLWMAGGVIAFWIGIGLPVAFVTSVTDPSRIFGIWWLTLAIGLLIGAMGFGIMGMFQIKLPSHVYAINPRADTAWGSFLFGVMTAVLGLPCFGFVAGALLAGAATLPAGTVILIFASLGVGMAAPYLVLAAKPSLVDRIPRTGPASELVKQVMGLLLQAAAAYFVGAGLIALVTEMPWMAKQLHWCAVAALAALAGIWMIIRTIQITTSSGRRIVFGVIGLFVAGVAVSYALDSTSKAKGVWMERSLALADAGDGFTTRTWNEFSPAAFIRAREEGYVVVLDFTAEWCLNCKALKATVLNRDPVKTLLVGDDVVPFVVDLTSRSAPGWKMLNDLGQTGIPLLVIYGPDDVEPWQANAYTPQQVVAALESARRERVAAR